MTEERQSALAILTYHSISDGKGPTSIPRDVFEMQMEAIAELGVAVVGLDKVERWLAGTVEFNRPTLAITFDDAFQDFADAAFPVLDRHGLRACVFAPTGAVGGVENWGGPNPAPRRLMNWSTIRALSKSGVDFGSHSQRHCDLTMLSAPDLDEELQSSRKRLEDELSRDVLHFAPPYGRSNSAVRAAIARAYSLSVGVRLDRVARRAPIFDLPRIEMHYYRDVRRWREFLAGEGVAYLMARRALRAVRNAIETAI